MFRYGWRRSPIRLFGYLIAVLLVLNLLTSLIGGALTAGIGVAVFLPFLLFKMFFLFMVFSFAMHFVRGSRRPWARQPKAETEEDAEFRERVRKAREHLDDLFPQP